MGMINSIRASFPVTEAPASPASDAPRAQGSHPAGAAAPVAAPVLAQALQRAAAQAARDAYIKASIAAGISPLPLP